MDPQYQYEPLSSENTFRLLELGPGKPMDPLVCRLVATTPTTCPPYEAISYCWGNPQKTLKMSCDNRTISITENLDEVLRQLRHVVVWRTLWADAVCIDQENMPERAIQVKFMRKIYNRAQRVLIYLGSDDNETSACVDLCREFGRKQKDRVLPPAESASWDALARLFEMPWFRRVWVIQEVMEAREATMIYGNAKIDWHYVQLAAEWVVNHSHQPELVQRFLPTGIRNATFMGTTHLKLERESQVLELFHIGRNFEASVPKDKVFAMLSHPLDIPLGVDSIILQKGYFLAILASLICFWIAVWLKDEARTAMIVSILACGYTGIQMLGGFIFRNHIGTPLSRLLSTGHSLAIRASLLCFWIAVWIVSWGQEDDRRATAIIFSILACGYAGIQILWGFIFGNRIGATLSRLLFRSKGYFLTILAGLICFWIAILHEDEARTAMIVSILACGYTGIQILRGLIFGNHVGTPPSRLLLKGYSLAILAGLICFWIAVWLENEAGTAIVVSILACRYTGIQMLEGFIFGNRIEITPSRLLWKDYFWAIPQILMCRWIAAGPEEAVSLIMTTSIFACGCAEIQKLTGFIRIETTASRLLELETDYSKTDQEVFQDITVAIMKLYQSLDSLSYVLHGENIETDFQSWSPNWARGNTDIKILTSFITQPYNAGSNQPLNFELAHTKSLMLAGLRIDTLMSVSEVILPVDFTKTKDSARSNPLNEVLKPPRTKLQRYYTGEDMAEAHIMTLTASRGSSGARADPRIHRANFAAFLLASDLSKEVLDGYGLQGGGGATGPKSLYQQAAALVCSHRRFLVTMHGYIGLGPEAMKQGDLVCVLFGGRVPFILRHQDGHYNLIGESYVHGLMDGETVKSWQDGNLSLERFEVR